MHVTWDMYSKYFCYVCKHPSQTLPCMLNCITILVYILREIKSTKFYIDFHPIHPFKLGMNAALLSFHNDGGTKEFYSQIMTHNWAVNRKSVHLSFSTIN